MATRTQVRKAIRSVLRSVHRDLIEVSDRLLNSGGIDLDSYPHEVLAAKVIVKAALMNEQDHFALPDDRRVKSDVRNLTYF